MVLVALGTKLLMWKYCMRLVSSETSIFYNFIDFTRGIDRSGAEVSRRTIRFFRKSIFFIS